MKTLKKLLLGKKHTSQLVLVVYKAIKYLPEDEKYNLISQITRAAVSVAANIVEGFHRLGSSDSLRFYNIAQVSLEELRYHIFLCKELEYFNQKQYNYLENLIEETGKTLYGWLKSQTLNSKNN